MLGDRTQIVITSYSIHYTKLYEQYTTEKKRQEIQGNSISLNDFIKSLELRMSFNQMDSSQIQRVSQLTMRTNQFNLSTIRRTEAELNELIHTNGYKCWVVEVIDRFSYNFV